MKKIRSISLAALLLACLSNGYAYTVIGKYDCGEWFTKRPSKAWLLGFLSGMNSARADDKTGSDPLGKLGSGDQAFLWMDNYCKANPLKSIVDGGMELFIELQMKQLQETIDSTKQLLKKQGQESIGSGTY
jgi:hypothetical protein